MPAAKRKPEPNRSCPFCRASMESLPDRVLLTTVSEDRPEAKRPTLAPRPVEWTDSLRVPMRAHVCEGCGFVALFEV